MDCFYAGWMTNRESGFSDDEVVTLERLTPFLGLAIKAVSLARIANTLVETYLGRDAGRRVLQGRIARGVADRIKTVLWFSELRNYVRISETHRPRRLFLSSTTMPTRSSLYPRTFGRRFEADRRWRAGDLSRRGSRPRVRAALDAADEARASVETVNERRRADGLPTVDFH